MENKYGCPHYSRKCEILAPCCNMWHGCRHCHNDLYKGPKGPGCTVEQLSRSDVKKIRCLLCKEEQPPSAECINCGVTFAKYYCEKCIFYDDSNSKEIFHCDDCGMCRIGKKEENQHCFTCGLCISKSSINKHKCLGIRGQKCPICMESLFESIKPYVQLSRCSHWIHVECFENYCHTSEMNRCPVCGTSIIKMEKEDIEVVDMIIEENKAAMPAELKDKKVSILCLDCLNKCEEVEFNWIALKCTNCGSYNTKQ